MQTIPPNLQLVPGVRFYQKRQPLLAVPEKRIQHTHAKSVFLPFTATSPEASAFNSNTILPSTEVRSLPWGILQTLTFVQVALK